MLPCTRTLNLILIYINRPQIDSTFKVIARPIQFEVNKMSRLLLRDEVPVGPCKVRALFSWSGETPQDLGFVEGDIIDVLNNGDGDWWTGKLKRNKLVGLFPRNLVEYVDKNQQTMSAALRGRSHGKQKLKNYTLENRADDLDFPSFSLADLQISEPPKEGEAEVPNQITSKLNASQNSQSSKASRTQLQSIPQLNSSQMSNLSTKSAQEILEDVAIEINGGFLDDINFNVKPDELRTPELYGGGFDFESRNQKKEFSTLLDSDLSVASSTEKDAAPSPPPHKVSVNKRSSLHSRAQSFVPENPINFEDLPKVSSALTGPFLNLGTGPTSSIGSGIRKGNDFYAKSSHSEPHWKFPDSLADIASIQFERSPDLGREIPFDPTAFTRENSIGDHIGSHFDSSAYNSNLGENAGIETGSSSNSKMPVATPERSSVVVPKSRRSFRRSAAAEAESNEAVTVFYSQSNDFESKKSTFFKRLFPKNTQSKLGRTFSRSSRKSTKSFMSSNSVGKKLRNVKSILTFAFNSDDSLYPTNNLSTYNTNSEEPTVVSAPIADNKRIFTPPRASLSGLGLTSHIRLAQRSSDASSHGGLGNSNSKDPLAGKWIEARRDLYRAKTLTDRDMQKRRQDLALQGIISENLVESLNTQNLVDFHDYRLEDCSEVDRAVYTMSTWPQLMTPSVFASSRIGRHFKDPVERARAVFLLCATRIQHVEQTPPGNNVMQSRTATPMEIAETFKAMCSGLDIECISIQGHRRVVSVGESCIRSIPHAWNAVQINGQWRLIDAVAAASAAPPSHDHSVLSINLHPEEDEEDMVNFFYFLTPPSQLIYTHVPADKHQQFCTPTLPIATIALLPLASPAAFAHGIYFDEFWLGMTRVSDLEVTELNFSVPDASKDLVALVDGKYQALAQAYWSDVENSRHFRIKAFVPPHKKQAMLQVYVVPKAQTSRAPENMELMWTVELRHVSGGKNNAEFQFVGRYPVPSAKNYDMYVIEPQCRLLGGGDNYTFKVKTFDAQWGKASRDKQVRQPKLAMQSPSGRLTRLIPIGTDVNDTFRATVKTLEVGTWRAAVKAKDDDSWVPFAEWFCA